MHYIQGFGVLRFFQEWLVIYLSKLELGVLMLVYTHTVYLAFLGGGGDLLADDCQVSD